MPSSQDLQAIANAPVPGFEALKRHMLLRWLVSQLQNAPDPTLGGPLGMAQIGEEGVLRGAQSAFKNPELNYATDASRQALANANLERGYGYQKTRSIRGGGGMEALWPSDIETQDYSHITPVPQGNEAVANMYDTLYNILRGRLSKTIAGK